MNLEDAKNLNARVNNLRGALKQGMVFLEENKPVSAYKVLIKLDEALYEVQSNLSKAFPHELT